MKNYPNQAAVSAVETEQPRQHSPAEGAIVATGSIIAGGALLVIALVLAGVLGLGAIMLAIAVVAGAASLPWLMMAVGGTARAGFYMVEQLTKRDLNHDGYTGQPGEVRFIPYHQWQEPQVRQSGSDTAFDRRDLIWLINRLDYKGQEGWQERQLLGKVMPSGIVIDRDEYDEFINILTTNGFLIGRSERTKGRLLAERERILDTLGL